MLAFAGEIPPPVQQLFPLIVLSPTDTFVRLSVAPPCNRTPPPLPDDTLPRSIVRSLTLTITPDEALISSGLIPDVFCPSTRKLPSPLP